MNKRAIAILGAIFILIVGTLGFLIYQRQHKNKLAAQNQQNQAPAAPQTPQAPPAEPPPESQPQAIKLTDDEVVSPVLFFQGTGITYLNSRGQLFNTDLQIAGDNVLLSNKRELTIPLKAGITKVLWPQNGNKFLAEFGSGTSRTWSFYDTATGTYTDLPSQITAVDWLPASDKI